VALRPRRRTRPIRVALRVADRALRARVAAACAAAGIAVTDDDEAASEIDADIAADINDGGDFGVDIVLADRPVDTGAPVIALISGEDEIWPGDVRAAVPADIDGTTLGAVIAVVAAGLVVRRRDDDGGEDGGRWPDPVDGAGTDDVPIALTPREREVLALLAEGASNKAIARALAVSLHTAKFHVASLTEKLGAHSRLEAIAIAIRAGLVMV
jgi:DNA-binding CsgD family transcriptional regulator